MAGRKSDRGQPLPREVEQRLLELTGFKKKRFESKIKNILRDHLLWLRLKHSDSDLSSIQVFKTEEPSEEYIAARNNLCDDFLKDGSRATQLRDCLSATSVKDKQLRAALFPGLPESVREVIQAEEVVVQRVSDWDGHGTHKGVVTDLYAGPADAGGWEGYVTSVQNGAVYKFSSPSCACSFPVCLGSTVEFQLQRVSSDSVAGASLRVVDYLPDTLPHTFTAHYLQNLESRSLESLLQRIMQLPGPLKAILNEPTHFGSHFSQVLAVLDNACNAEDDDFSRVVETLHIHTSKFLNSFSQFLSRADSEETTRNDIMRFLHLVSRCVCTLPNSAFKMSTVIGGCAKLASSYHEQLMSQGPDLCCAIVHASSVVRHMEPLERPHLPLVEEDSTMGLLDPLLWVTQLFGKATANSLRKYIPRKPLSEDTGGVCVRRKLENFIPSETTSDKQELSRRVLIEIDLRPAQSSLAGQEKMELRQKTGIVIDLYPNREGYVVLTTSRQEARRYSPNQKVFKIGLTTTASSVLGDSPTIHLGDIVQFEVSPATPDTVHRVTKIQQYSSQALTVEFARGYLSQNRELDKLFQNEAALRSIFNAPQVYESQDVCAKLISTSLEALSESTAFIKKMMVNSLKSSYFIRDLIQIAPEEISKSVKILEKYLECFPNEICVLAPTLESMVSTLQKQDKPLEIAKFVSFLSTSTCLLPHSVEIARQPWQSIPTILTPDECRAGAVTNQEYLPAVKDNYSSVHEYGRTYFLLLRADCHGDLASLISQLREGNCHKKRDTDDNVMVLDAQMTGFSNRGAKHALVYTFSVKTRPKQVEVLSRETPLLKAGNLLCLSISGRFRDDIIWATVNHVSSFVHSQKTEAGVVKLVRKNMKARCPILSVSSCSFLQCDAVEVELCTESNSLSDEEAIQQLKTSRNVVALESPAYFRSYQPVLEVLKQMDMEKIHFM